MDVSASFCLSKKVDDVHVNGEEQALHVLAVDDNLIDRKIVEKLLKNSSSKVTTAENGLRAIEYLGLRDDHQNTLNGNGSKVNMIITDYCMPGMTGYELLKKIKVILIVVMIIASAGLSDATPDKKNYHVSTDGPSTIDAIPICDKNSIVDGGCTDDKCNDICLRKYQGNLVDCYCAENAKCICRYVC